MTASGHAAARLVGLSPFRLCAIPGTVLLRRPNIDMQTLPAFITPALTFSSQLTRSDLHVGPGRESFEGNVYSGTCHKRQRYRKMLMPAHSSSLFVSGNKYSNISNLLVRKTCAAHKTLNKESKKTVERSAISR